MNSVSANDSNPAIESLSGKLYLGSDTNKPNRR